MNMFSSLRSLLGLEKKEYSNCMIVTEQEGAEIWLHGENTFKVTPALIKIEQNKEIPLALKYHGHETHFVHLLTDKPRSFYYTDLKRTPLRLIKCQETYEHSL